MIRRMLIVSRELYFPEHLYYEDLAVTPLWYVVAKNVRKVNFPLYFYMIRKTSIMQTPSAEKLYMLIDIVRYLINLSKKIGTDKVFGFELLLYILNHLRFHIEFLYENCKPQFYDWCLKLKSILNIDLSCFDEFDTKSIKRIKLFAEFLVNVNEQATEEFGLFIIKEQRDFQINNFIELYNALPNENRRICVWGVGIRGTRLSNILALTDISVSYTDINPTVQGKIMPDGGRVEIWDNVKDSTDIIIICTSAHYKSVRKIVGNEYLIIDYEKYLSEDCSAERFIKIMEENRDKSQHNSACV